MADEQDQSQKTEDPTQKRLEEARKKGDIAKSQDVPIWFLMMAVRRCATRWNGTAITRLPRRACTITHSNGDRNGPALTWRASAIAIPTSGTARI